MSRIITDSDLGWTIVRFIAPKNGDATGIIRTGFFGDDKIGWGITRAESQPSPPPKSAAGNTHEPRWQSATEYRSHQNFEPTKRTLPASVPGL
jgi:hypothetical protein